jgi:hypothetical protein
MGQTDLDTAARTAPPAGDDPTALGVEDRNNGVHVSIVTQVVKNGSRRYGAKNIARCATCDSKFTPNRSGSGVYCSQKCYKRRRPRSQQCHLCGGAVPPGRGNDSQRTCKDCKRKNRSLRVKLFRRAATGRAREKILADKRKYSQRRAESAGRIYKPRVYGIGAARLQWREAVKACKERLSLSLRKWNETCENCGAALNHLGQKGTHRFCSLHCWASYRKSNSKEYLDLRLHGSLAALGMTQDERKAVFTDNRKKEKLQWLMEKRTEIREAKKQLASLTRQSLQQSFQVHVQG